MVAQVFKWEGDMVSKNYNPIPPKPTGFGGGGEMYNRIPIDVHLENHMWTS